MFCTRPLIVFCCLSLVCGCCSGHVSCYSNSTDLETGSKQLNWAKHGTSWLPSFLMFDLSLIYILEILMCCRLMHIAQTGKKKVLVFFILSCYHKLDKKLWWNDQVRLGRIHDGEDLSGIVGWVAHLFIWSLQYIPCSEWRVNSFFSNLQLPICWPAHRRY